MTNKAIKAFFQAIRSGELRKVVELIDTDREYLAALNFAPPKKDDGQSGLQIAFKVGEFEIAKFLIEQGADVNFIETSEINEWTAPVLHDCIRATIFSSFTLQKDTGKFDRAFSLLQLMLDKKADPNAIDSFGNNCLNRAFLDARQMIDNPAIGNDIQILLAQMRRVFKALINAGGDLYLCNEKRPCVADQAVSYKMDKYQL